MSENEGNQSVPSTLRRIAMVVGVNKTQSSNLPALRHAEGDAQAMAEVLERCEFELLVPPLLGERATSEEFRKAIRLLARDRNDDDFLLLYFSGHGQPMLGEAERELVYLGSTDFNERDVEDEETAHVHLQYLRERLYEGTQAGRVLVILDCCFSGNMGRTERDQYLEELRQRIEYYFKAPGSESRARSGGLRQALTATGHYQPAAERDGHGIMTGYLLDALRGKIEEVIEVDYGGQISLQGLYRYLQHVMQKEQTPSLSGDTAGRDCILVYNHEAAQLIKRNRLAAKHPNPWSVPFPRERFLERPKEFAELEAWLPERSEQEQPEATLVGIVGLSGVGKTGLAVELAYRFREQRRFPGGIFCMTATGTRTSDWQRPLAELAYDTGYLPPDDDISQPGNEEKRAQHFARYLAAFPNALLILDNVDDPRMIVPTLNTLAGAEVKCNLLYTSQHVVAAPGARVHVVKPLPEDIAIKLFIGVTQAKDVLSGLPEDIEAAHEICRAFGCLPQSLKAASVIWELNKSTTSLVEFAKAKGFIPRRNTGKLRNYEQPRGTVIVESPETPTRQQPPAFKPQEPVTPGPQVTPTLPIEDSEVAEVTQAAYLLIWQQVKSQEARRLFLLAAYFPEAAPIPLWLLGLAAGLGEQGDILGPLGQARMELREHGLLKELVGEQVWLHPQISKFGRQLVAGADEWSKGLLKDAGRRLAAACIDLSALEQHARKDSYWRCIERVREIRKFAERLGVKELAQQIQKVENWLRRESYLLDNSLWWPDKISGLFYQQLYNRAVESEQLLWTGEGPKRWLRQTKRVGAENAALLCILTGHTSTVNCTAFSPDGQLALTGSADYTARMWELSSGHEVMKFTGHTASISSIAFSPDGTHVLTGSADHTARLWEVSTGLEVMKFTGHTASIYSLAFSPDGRYILTGAGMSRAEELADLALRAIEEARINRELEEARREFEQVNQEPTDLPAVLPSPKRTVPPRDYSVCLWEISSGHMQMQFKGHSDNVYSVAFSLDGQSILTGSKDNTVRLWDKSSGELMQFSGHTSGIYSAVFSPDGRYVLTASADTTARLWEVSSGQELLRCKGHTSEVYCAVFSLDAQQVLTCSDDETIRLWKTSSGEELRHLKVPTGSSIATPGKQSFWSSLGNVLVKDPPLSSVIFSPDRRSALICQRDSTVWLWEVDREIGAEGKGELGSPVFSVTFSLDGQYMFTGAQDGTVHLWHVSTEEDLGSTNWLQSTVRSVACSPDGQQMLAAFEAGTAYLWDSSLRSGVTFEGHTKKINSITLSPDRKLVLTGSDDETTRLWDASNGQELMCFAEPKPQRKGLFGAIAKGWDALVKTKPRVLSVAFSPEGTLALSGSKDKVVRVWDVSSGQKLGSLSGHTGAVTCLAFSSEGHIIITGSEDKTARIWDTSSMRQLFIIEHKRTLSCVNLSPRGFLAITCDEAGHVYLWRAREPEVGSLLGLYIAPHEIVAVCWQDARHIILADSGETYGKPFMYHLALEGDWEG